MAEPSVSAAPPKRKRRRLKIVLTVICLIGAYFVYAHWPRESTFTIGPDTTVISGPLNPDGTINYVQYLVDRYSEGVTRDNNGAVLLAQALGPDLFDEDIRAEALRELGLTEAELSGPFFQNLADFRNARPPDASLRETFDLLHELIARPWTSEEFPEVAEWLALNASPLALVTEASQRTFIHLPIISASTPPSVMAIPLPASCRQVTKALAVRAMLHVGNGDLQAARADLRTVHLIGRKLARAPSLLQWLTGLAADKVAYYGDRALLTGGQLSGEELRAFIADSDGLPPLTHAAEAVAMERFFLLDAVMMLHRSGGQDLSWAITARDERRAPWVLWRPDASLDWNEMLRTVNRRWDWMVDSCAAPTYPESRRQIAEYDAALVADHQIWFTIKLALCRLGGRPFRRAYTRGVSQLVMTTLMPTLAGSRTLYEKALVNCDLNRLTAGALLYEIERGEFPAELADLAPGYLDEIPIDRFSGEALIYQRTDEGFRIYSVGANMTDDGGLDKPHDGDIVVEFPPPPAEDSN